MVERVRTARRAAGIILATATAAGGLLLACMPAQAQFFWDQPRYSADDVARLTMQHGFRPLSPLVRNDDVYVAEVLDQRGRRERLVVNADSGEILQRFFIDEGRRYRRYADPSIPRGPIPPGRIPDEDNRSLVTRLAPDDGAADRPPSAFEPDEQPAPRPRRVRRPRLVDQAPETVSRPAPVESEPLAPPVTAPAPLRHAMPTAPVPAQAALPLAAAPAVDQPAAPAPAAADAKPSRPVSKDPLAIPGSREQDQATARDKAAATASAVDKAVKPAAGAKPAVPVAPLE